ncbi:MAG: HAMP domain-containing sensor histidine kinase, partial [Kibdelosporangium sp.]
LALLYTSLVLLAGVVLIALTYVLVRRDRPKVLMRTGPLPDTDALPAFLDDLHTENLGEFLTQSTIALAVVAVLAAVLGWLVAGRVLRPIRAVSATAQRLSAEDLSSRVPVPTPQDELATLAETINNMLDRIQSGVDERDRLLASQRMFVAHAAHELRTPLTTMRTAVDVTLDGEPTTGELLAMAADVSTAIEHSQRTLDGLLVLARSQSGGTRQRSVDLADLVAAATCRLDARQVGAVELRTDLRPAPMTGEPVLLDRMVGNLVDNAVRYNHPGGHIAVSTGQSYLRIVNTGQQVEPDAVDTLFEPFVRGRHGRGAGLGLSIVRAVVTAHHGSLRCTPRPDGGLDITVRFPPQH